MEGFDDLSFPSFDTAPESAAEVAVSACKKSRAEPARTTDVQPYYHDGSGDMQFFTYHRLAHVPVYKLASQHVVGTDERDEGGRGEGGGGGGGKDERLPLKVLDARLPLFSKRVQNALSRTVMEDGAGNIQLLDYDDSMVTSIYDPELIRQDRVRVLEEELQHNPHNISAWIGLAHEQQQASHQLSERAVLERKQAILQRALTANMGNVELLKEYIAVHRVLNGPSETVQLVERLVQRYPSLLPFHFDQQLHDSHSFSVFQMQERFEGMLDGFGYVKFLFDSGYTERAIGIIDHLWGVHYGGAMSTSFTSHPDWLPLDIYVPPPTVAPDSAQTALLEWLKVESYRSYKFATPRSAGQQYIDEPEEDPDRIVCPEDVHMFTFAPTLGEVFTLFGFDASIPHPFILVDYSCFDHVRKAQAVSTIPSDLKQIVSRWCLDALARDPLTAAFHCLVLRDGDMGGLDASGSAAVAEACVTYLCCQGRLDEAYRLACQSPKSRQTRLLVAELALKLTGGIDRELLDAEDDATLPYRVYLQAGAECMAKQLSGTAHWHHPGVLSLLLHSDDKLLLPAARSWLVEHQSTTRFAFDALVQFEQRYSSSRNIHRVLAQATDVDDYRIFALFIANNSALVRQCCGAMQSAFQAILSIIHAPGQQESTIHCLQAINKHPAVKQVYLAAIDRLCAVGDPKTALNVLTVMQERGIRCRTLLEELY